MKLIKRLGKFTENIKLDKEFNYILKQLVHKDDAITKNSITKTIEYDGTGTLKIEVKNGQIIKIEIEG